ncbi:MAG: hypothetical protein ACR2LK_05780 [Solirubrobacteraceae bacterium]
MPQQKRGGSRRSTARGSSKGMPDVIYGQASPTSINIAGPAEAYERAFSTKLTTVERDVIKPGAREDTATFISTCRGRRQVV